MEDELFVLLYRLLRRLRPRRGKRVVYSDALVVAAYLWAVLNDRPMNWACSATARRPPGFEREGGADWPSNSTLSKRLATASCRALLGELESHLLSLQCFSTMLGVYLIDGKPLRVSDYSKDDQAGWGWAYRTKAKGYKLFLLTDARGNVVTWRVGKMCDDERTIGKRLIRGCPRLLPGYLVGDKKYDANTFYVAAAKRGLQHVAPRTRPGGGVNNGGCHATRHRAIDLLESGLHAMGQPLYDLRTGIERTVSTLCCRGHGLKDLPPWVRTYARVRRYVQAKILIHLADNHRGKALAA
jgi:DDE family transposase